MTKQHVFTFLKALKYPHAYKHIHLIYSTLTQKPLLDLSSIETQLMDDFDQLIYAYQQQDFKRTNFINTHYVLYQLLKERYDIPCSLHDFPELHYKHNPICHQLFSALGWRKKLV